MPKTIDLKLPDTGAIEKLDTGEMTAIAIKAIQKESEARRQQAITKQTIATQQASDRVISYFFDRIIERGKLWKYYYDMQFKKDSPLK